MVRSYRLILIAIVVVIGLVTLVLMKKPFNKSAIDIKKIDSVSNIVPVAVIGAGAAGLSAALYTARGGLHTVVFAGPDLGGQLTKTMYVENWPGTLQTNGTELMDTVRKQSEKFGAVVANDTIAKVDFSSWPFTLTTASGDTINALSVIIATGGLNKKLGVPGEDEYLGKGVAVCGVCDAALFKDENVAVVGGGDAAVQEAMLVAQYAKDVKLLVASSGMKATKCMQDRLLQHKNVEVLFNTQVAQIQGDGKQVTGVEIQNRVDGTTNKLPVTGVFIGVGQTPNSQLFKDQVACNQTGHIELVERTQNTSVPGVFAAGSVAEGKSTQAAVSSGDAIKAALSAMDFLNEHEVTDIYLKKIAQRFYVPKNVVDSDHIMAMLRNTLGSIPV